jgi:hypothetical protein
LKEEPVLKRGKESSWLKMKMSFPHGASAESGRPAILFLPDVLLHVAELNEGELLPGGLLDDSLGSWFASTFISRWGRLKNF